MELKILKICVRDTVSMRQNTAKKHSVVKIYPFMKKIFDFANTFFIVFQILSRPPNFLNTNNFNLQAY
jgi:hypothetical protein